MDNEQLKRLERLVNKKVFDKSVEHFGLNKFLFGNDHELIPKNIYFIKVRQPSKPGIDTIAMFKETKGNIMHFKQYYFRERRLGGPYKIFQETNNDIKIPIENDLYIVDITDRIEKESRKLDRKTLAFLGSDLTGPNIVKKTPYSVGTSNTGVIPIMAEFLGGKKRIKKTSKSTRKKNPKKSRHNKTKNKNN